MVIDGDLQSFSLAHLPIVKEYAHRMGFVAVVNQALNCGMRTGPGTILLGLVMNVLCGRSPLYRVEEFFGSRDVELLLGPELTAERFNDDALGRVLDRIHEYGTWKLFSEICLVAFRNFTVDCSVVHQDTTSVSVWGDYEPSPRDPLTINHGFSKDKRPDLKQFILSLLCVEGNLPCHAGMLDGNASDKTTNGSILAELPQIMARHGVKDREFIYVADSALVTRDNLALMADGIYFISRLPENFGSCRELIRTAASGSWEDVGQVSHRIVKGKEIRARYRLQEQSIELYERRYRVVVVHSDAHDQRRQKRLAKAVTTAKALLEAHAVKLHRQEFFCRADAEAAAMAFPEGALHRITWVIEERPIYGRGRPRQNESPVPKSIRYRVRVEVTENQEAIAQLREEAGCFVLLTTVSEQQNSGQEILTMYKEQDGIEKNFGFLKDPLIVNDVFLKKPHRIEAMGLVLIVALLLWRLMERSMRTKTRNEKIPLQGWNNGTTLKPTSFMMVSKFAPVFVGVRDGQRFLFANLNQVQLDYLSALGVHPDVFTRVNSGVGSIRAG
jgi:transposase